MASSTFEPNIYHYKTWTPTVAGDEEFQLIASNIQEVPLGTYVMAFNALGHLEYTSNSGYMQFRHTTSGFVLDALFGDALWGSPPSASTAGLVGGLNSIELYNRGEPSPGVAQFKCVLYKFI